MSEPTPQQSELFVAPPQQDDSVTTTDLLKAKAEVSRLYEVVAKAAHHYNQTLLLDDAITVHHANVAWIRAKERCDAIWRSLIP